MSLLWNLGEYDEVFVVICVEEELLVDGLYWDVVVMVYVFIFVSVGWFV